MSLTSSRASRIPPPLYAIADLEVLGSQRLEAAVATMAEAGIGWIQLRAKHASGAELCALAERCRRRLEGSPSAFWIDDRADVAAIVAAQGVHVGQRDLPPAAARRVVGEEVWIGLSTHDEAQLRAADADPEVDVVALGPIFETRSKDQPAPLVGLEGLARGRQLTGKPLVAIGGIDASNLERVLASGADSAAVLGALCRGDVARNCRRLRRAVEELGCARHL